MERDLAQEIDEIKRQLADLQAMLRKESGLPVTDEPHPTIGHVEKMPGMIPDPALSAVLDRLENACGESGSTGRIAYLGVYASGGRQSTWMRGDVNTDTLLDLIENRTAEKVLACIGSNDRLNMLLAILRKPRTVAELVSDCGFSSAGQVYHHLKPLLTADLVAEDEQHRGAYVIQPHRVQGVIMLLAGIADLVDTAFTQGQFD